MSKFKTQKVVKLQGKEYVLFEGLLEVTHENYHLMGFSTDLIQLPTEENGMTAIAKAIVTVKDGEDVKQFSGIGDASPSSVNRMIAPHIVRMAETRALGRAMRFLTGFGTVFEELGDVEKENKPQKKQEKTVEKKKEAPKASQAQLNKIEKDAKALGLSAEEVYTHLDIDSKDVKKTDASKVIKFLKTNEAKELASKEEDSTDSGSISDDDLPF
ncbi:hypothetical protein ABE236_18325 [Priestia endophytica]|uniref:hypothetical protein n=1 Tax=Priestia endophytica TaxID=135735 RepID=UPI003D2756F9